jgi:aspartate racemase
LNDKIIGIIGGMGPEATANLYLKIIKATRINVEQDHFRVIIDSNPKIPDRTKAIMGQGESPVNAIVDVADNLMRAGVEVACIPCMTSHYFYDEIVSRTKLSIMNAFVELEEFLKEAYPDAKRIGVLCTDGTKRAKLFDRYLSSYCVIYPSDRLQKDNVMGAIYAPYGIKHGFTTGKPVDLLKQAVDELVEMGADVVIAGCTEVGFVLENEEMSVDVIDTLDVLARSIVAKNCDLKT